VPEEESTMRALRCLPLVLALLVPPAWAELAPGERKVRQDVVVDLGPFAAHATRTYKVERGDTLSQIAENLLGTVKRLPEITALNPGLTPEGLKAGALLLLPPEDARHTKASPADGGPGWWDFFAVLADGRGGLERLPTSGALPFHPEGARLVAVPHAKLPAFERARARTSKRDLAWIERLAERGEAALSPSGLGGYVVRHAESPVDAERLTVAVRAIEDGRIDLAVVRTERFGADGAVLHESPLSIADALWIAMAALGAVALLVVILRRRAAEEIRPPSPHAGL
jgi:hypothetical protein